MYVKIVNSGVDTFPYSIRQLKQDNASTSFPSTLTAVQLADWGVYPVTQADKPSYTHTQTVDAETTPTLIDSVWTLGWVIRDLTDAETSHLAKLARQDRDEKLVKSDWTQMPDSPLDDTAKASWAIYRTALRNVPAQTDFPTNITWPTAP